MERTNHHIEYALETESAGSNPGFAVDSEQYAVSRLRNPGKRTGLDEKRALFVFAPKTYAWKLKAVCLRLFGIVALTLLFSSSLRGETIYRLPLRGDFGTEVVELFERAVDSTLAGRFEVIPIESEDAYNPDSNVFSAELKDGDSGRVLFSFDLYRSRNRSVVSDQVSIPKDEVDFGYLVVLFQDKFKSDPVRELELTRLRVHGSRRARVFLNGELAGRVPFETFAPPGVYEVRIEGKRFIHSNHQVRLTPGADTSMKVDLRELSRPYRIGAFVAAGVCAGAAAYLQYRQGRLYDEYRDPELTRTDFDRAYNRYARAVFGRNVFAALGGMALALGVVVTWDLP